MLGNNRNVCCITVTVKIFMFYFCIFNIFYLVQAKYYLAKLKLLTKSGNHIRLRNLRMTTNLYSVA